MRRKVLQDFANVFCQQFVDLGSGSDVVTFVELGSGVYTLNILSGECRRDGVPIPELKVCGEYRTWLQGQLAKHKVPQGIEYAGMTIGLEVANVTVEHSFGHTFGGADFTYACRSEIRTDEVTYAGHMRGSRRWGFMPEPASRQPGWLHRTMARACRAFRGRA